MPEPTDFVDQVLHDIAHGIAPRAATVTAALDQRRQEKAEMKQQPASPWKRLIERLFVARPRLM